MFIAIAQINSTIGDFKGNCARILDFAKRAADKGADLALFPELAICGYPPMDLLDMDSFTEMNIRALRSLQRELPAKLACGVGYVNRSPYPGGKSLVNMYGVIQGGQIIFEQVKTLLPTYDVFDEARNFEPAREWQVFEFPSAQGGHGERIGVAICEDVWRESDTPGTRYIEDPVRRLCDRGATLLCVPSASPYVAGKLKTRRALAERISLRENIPVIYLNAVGANDQIIFDGRSFVTNAKGETVLEAKAFEEDLICFELKNLTTNHGGCVSRLNQANKEKGNEHCSLLTIDYSLSSDELDTLEGALVMGIREYMRKCGFKRAHLGLSGGIDSALVAYLGVQAIGAANVTTFSMPSRFSSQGSKDDAADLAANLGIRYEVLPIEPVYTSFLDALKGVFEGRPFDLAEENLQARIRGILVMAFSNKFNSMGLTTGNKSELAMGYCTLYGDMCGALAPIGDLFKTEVFALCRRINARWSEAGKKPPIPQAIIDKPPSAELRPNQKDQDSLPPYDTLDAILRLYLFDNLSKEEIVEKGWDAELVGSVIRTVARAEFKRRQAPPVLKVSPRAFGMGRRHPIARSIFELD
jgi:NAD+ synthase (glutamine-hydrolysing)